MMQPTAVVYAHWCSYAGRGFEYDPSTLNPVAVGSSAKINWLARRPRYLLPQITSPSLIYLSRVKLCAIGHLAIWLFGILLPQVLKPFHDELEDAARFLKRTQPSGAGSRFIPRQTSAGRAPSPPSFRSYPSMMCPKIAFSSYDAKYLPGLERRHRRSRFDGQQLRTDGTWRDRRTRRVGRGQRGCTRETCLWPNASSRRRPPRCVCWSSETGRRSSHLSEWPHRDVLDPPRRRQWFHAGCAYHRRG